MMLPPEDPAKTYRALCEDLDKNPLGSGEPLAERLAEIYASWGAGAAFLDKDELFEEVLLDMNTEFIGGIGVFVTEANQPGGTLQIIHSPRKHAQRGAHRGKCFAYLGDLCGQSIDIVNFNTQLLDFAPEVNVVNNVDIQSSYFDNHAASELAPSVPDGIEDLRRIKTRRSMFIPFPFIPYVIGCNLTAREALNVLVPVIRNFALEEVCSQLIDFLVVASTHSMNDGPPATEQAVFTAPLGLASVREARRTHILGNHLSALITPLGDPGIPGLGDALGTLQEVRTGYLDDLADRRLERAATNQPKTVVQRWKAETVDRLLKLCNVEDTELLPAFWHELAAHKKTQGTVRSLLQDAVETAAKQLRVRHPTVTTQHASALTDWTFYGSEIDLGEGILPFTITPPDQVSLAAVAQIQLDHHQNRDFSAIMTGSTSISAADARAMRSSKGYIPVDWDEAEVQIEAYTPVLAAILGEQHPNVMEHVAATAALRRFKPLLKQFMSAKLGIGLSAATIVWYFHMKHRNWFRKQWSKDVENTTKPPAILAGFEQFEDGYNLAWLPYTGHIPRLQALARPPPAPYAPAPAPATGQSSSPAIRPSTNTPRNDNTDSDPARDRVRNRNRDSRYMGETPFARRIRKQPIREAIARMEGPPLTSDGGERCLSWHLKGSCRAGCGRASDHIVLPTEDAEALYQWCQRAFE